MAEYDLVIVGAGAAGLSLAHRMSGVNGRRSAPLRVALIEPPVGPTTPVPRTWCFWERDGGDWDHLLMARWDALTVIGSHGSEQRSSAAPYVYKMLRSVDVDANVRSNADPHMDQLTLTVTALVDGAEGATVHAEPPEGRAVSHTARWVVDTRPAPPADQGATTLLQHFRGWFVRTPTAAFDPSAALLMDFRPPQPANGVAFGYVLPLSEQEALVEYTEFGRQELSTPQYERALANYCSLVGLPEVEVQSAEQGVIPMTDARFSTRAGRRIFRMGTAGGATRPATGYTFSGVLRQAAAVADALEHDREPLPPVPHRSRHLMMDAIMLRALDRGHVEGSHFFEKLFTANALHDVLAFLDGESSLPRELAMGLTTPVAAMSRAAAEHAWHALTTRR